MTPTARFRAAAMGVLDGDESRDAGALLEQIVIEDYPDNKGLEELLYALAMYAPGAGAAYFGAEELRREVGLALSNFHDSTEEGFTQIDE